MHFSTISNALILLATAASSAPTLDAETYSDMSLLHLFHKRQTASPCTQWTPQTRLVGDGSPKDWWLWKQVTGEMRCGDADTCSIQAGEYESITINADLTGGASYISGGFGVEKSWETGTSWSCEEKAGNKVCLWLKIAHTEYEVEDGTYNSCSGFQAGRKHRITSPNKNNNGGYHECSRSDCREVGAQYWVDS